MNTNATRPFAAGSRGSRRTARILRHWWWRTRYLLAAILLLLAASAAASQHRPTTAVAQTVVVAARDIAPGVQLSRADLAVAELPSAVLEPDVFADADAAVGQQALVAIPAGMPVYQALFVGDKLTSQAPEGTVVVPIRLDDAAAALLRPGDHIDLLLTSVSRSWADDADEAEPTYLTRRALVLPDGDRLSGSTSSGPLPNPGILSSSRSDPEITLVAVAAEDAARLSTVSLSGSLAAVLVP